MFTIVQQQNDSRRQRGRTKHEVIDHRALADTEKWKEVVIPTTQELSYKTLKTQRDSLMESEILYKKKIRELEKERLELIELYEPTYQENKKLKSIIEHGPDAVKMKKLQKARNELEREMELLRNENKNLSGQMKELMTSNAAVKSHVLENTWQTVLTSVKKRNDEKDANTAARLSPDKKQTRNANISKNDKDDLMGDTYDLKLDNVEKEIQILLNNVKTLKKEKEKVDYAVSMNKGAITNNPVLENALQQKLDADIATFRNNLKVAKKKHEDLKQMIANEKRRRERETDIKDNVMTKSVSYVENKPYISTETQTDPTLEMKRAKSDISSNKSKKKEAKQTLKSRSVQTESVNVSQLRNAYESHDSPSPQKLSDKGYTTEDVNEKISSRKLRTEYAKKLLIKYEPEGNIREKVSHKRQPIEEKSFDQRIKVNKMLSPELKVKDQQPDMINVTKQKTMKLKAKEQMSKKPNGTEKPVSEKKTTREDRKHYLPKYSDKPTPKLKLLRKRRLLSRSVGDVDRDIADYNEKIIDKPSVHLPTISKQPNTTPTYISTQYRGHNSQSRLQDGRDVKGKIVGTHKQRLLSKDDRYTWKSESDLGQVNTPSEPYVKNFSFVTPRRQSYLHFTGELLYDDDTGYRDESAYDEVLADTETQLLNSDRLYRDFKDTVISFRQYKESLREKQVQKGRHVKEDIKLPELTPLRFSNDAKSVTTKYVRKLLG